MTLGGNGAMVVIKREPGEGQEKAAYYMEIIDWGVPDDVRLAAEHDSMKQGTAQTLSLQSNAQYEMLPAWSSSDHRILSVTQSGKVTAWREGTAIITAKVSETISRSIEITVTASDIISPKVNVLPKSGAATSNYSANNDTVWSSAVDSYMMENEDGTLTTVQFVQGTGVRVDIYSTEYERISEKVLPAELDLFGGFFAGLGASGTGLCLRGEHVHPV